MLYVAFVAGREVISVATYNPPPASGPPGNAPALSLAVALLVAVPGYKLMQLRDWARGVVIALLVVAGLGGAFFDLSRQPGASLVVRDVAVIIAAIAVIVYLTRPSVKRAFANERG